MSFNPLENRPIVWVEPCVYCRGWVKAAFDKVRPSFWVMPGLIWLSSSDELIAWLCAAEVDERETVPLIIFVRGSVGPIHPVQLIGNLKSSPWRFIPVIMVIDRVNPVLIDQLWDSGADLVLLTDEFWQLTTKLRSVLKFYEIGELPSIGRLHGLNGSRRIQRIHEKFANPTD